MTKTWVVNASPIIFLAKIGYVHLLPELCPHLVIPAGVASEIQCGEENDPAKEWVTQLAKKISMFWIASTP